MDSLATSNYVVASHNSELVQFQTLRITINKQIQNYKTYLRQDRSSHDFKLGNSCLRRELLLWLLSANSTLLTLVCNIKSHNTYASNPNRNTVGRASVIHWYDFLHPVLLVDVATAICLKHLQPKT